MFDTPDMVEVIRQHRRLTCWPGVILSSCTTRFALQDPERHYPECRWCARLKTVTCYDIGPKSSRRLGWA